MNHTTSHDELINLYGEHSKLQDKYIELLTYRIKTMHAVVAVENLKYDDHTPDIYERGWNAAIEEVLKLMLQ